MARHAVKRIEILIDRPLLERAVRIIEEAGAKRYTVLPAIQGRGMRHQWDADELFGGDQKVILMLLASQEVADAVIERFEGLLDHFSCVLSAWDVEIVRRQKFQ